MMSERINSNPCIEKKCILVFLSLLSFTIMLASTDLHAQTWERMKMILPDGYSLLSNSGVDFATKDVGWLQTIGRDPSTDTQVSRLFKTTDGGDSWSYQSDAIGSVFVLDSNHIWMRTANYILVTKNGGQSYDSLECQISFDEWYFADQNNGIAIATWPGKQWFTEDGGASWNIGDTTMYFGSLTDIACPTRTHAWIVGEGSPFGSDIGMIAHTSDGGLHWEYQRVWPPSYQVPVVYGVDFFDSSFGFVVGTGHLLQTTDGGKSWKNRTDYFAGNDIKYLTEKLLFNTWGSGIINISRDGGESWAASSTGTDAKFLSLHPLKNDGYIYAFGKSPSLEFILARSDVNTLTHVEEQTRQNLTQLNILGPFPNPFVDDVTMDIQGPATRDIRITVRDLLGREVYRENVSIPHSGVYTLRWRPARFHISSATYVVTVSSIHSVVSAIVHHMKYAQ